MAAGLLTRLRGGDVLVSSCGLVAAEEIDPFVVAVMAEVGVDVSGHQPKDFQVLGEQPFDVVVALTAEAQGRVDTHRQSGGAQLEYWPTEDPTAETGSREQRLEAYRRVRDALDARVRARFSAPPARP